MPCNEWRDEWVAHLYGELSSDERSSIDEHLAACPSCSDTMRGLANSRRVLSESAPELPVAPRVVVLRPSRGWSPAWAFASGLAAATLVFFIGTLLAPRRPPAMPVGGEAVEHAEVAGLVEGLEERVMRLEEAPAAIQAQPAAEGMLTRDALEL
jgi:anti-sigma factor RsiW